MKWIARGVAVALTLLGAPNGLVLPAQEPDASADTNETTAAEVLSQLSEMMQSGDTPQVEDMAGSGNLSLSNSFNVPQAGVQAQAPAYPDRSGRYDNSSRSGGSNRFQNPGRSQNDDRHSRSRRSYRSRSDSTNRFSSSRDSSRSGDYGQFNPPPGTNAGLDYAAFRIIVDRNIFDPNRLPRRSDTRSRQPAPIVDSVTLVGTMSYEKGTFAFFDGTSSDYKKALKLNDRIAGYKLTNIAPDGVKLVTGTNEVALGVGMQLHREANGPWTVSSQAGSYAATTGSGSANAVTASTSTGATPAASASDNDVIKRMMQRREQE